MGLVSLWSSEGHQSPSLLPGALDRYVSGAIRWHPRLGFGHSEHTEQRPHRMEFISYELSISFYSFIYKRGVMWWVNCQLEHSGIILYMRPANERWCYIVTSSLIGWEHRQNDPSILWNGLDLRNPGVEVTQVRFIPFSIGDISHITKQYIQITFLSGGCHNSSAVSAHIKYEHDITYITTVLMILKNEENNGRERLV